MSYIVDAWTEILCPSPETIARRKEAERRRFAALPWRQKVGEVAKESFFGTAWAVFASLLVTILLGPWFYGVYALWERAAAN